MRYCGGLYESLRLQIPGTHFNGSAIFFKRFVNVRRTCYGDLVYFLRDFLKLLYIKFLLQTSKHSELKWFFINVNKLFIFIYIIIKQRGSNIYWYSLILQWGPSSCKAIYFGECLYFFKMFFKYLLKIYTKLPIV